MDKRYEDIIKAASEIHVMNPFMSEIREGFIMGAKWADDNQRNVYVVMRQEEHSDYAEKVFVDRKKAESYIKQFNEKKNEYSRYYEEMEVINGNNR